MAEYLKCAKVQKGVSEKLGLQLKLDEIQIVEIN
jgi:hypothetical protein